MPFERIKQVVQTGVEITEAQKNQEEAEKEKN